MVALKSKKGKGKSKPKTKAGSSKPKASRKREPKEAKGNPCHDGSNAYYAFDEAHGGGATCKQIRRAIEKGLKAEGKSGVNVKPRRENLDTSAAPGALVRHFRQYEERGYRVDISGMDGKKATEDTKIRIRDAKK